MNEKIEMIQLDHIEPHSKNRSIGGQIYNNWLLTIYRKFEKIIKQCNKWADYKLFLSRKFVYFPLPFDFPIYSLEQVEQVISSEDSDGITKS